MAAYSKSTYWDNRYQLTPNQPHEWYQSYRSLRHLLNPIHLATGKNGSARELTSSRSNVPFPSRDQCRILILGCGNSTFGEDLLRDGWIGPIVNVDFSEVVIQQMQQKYNDDFYANLTKESSQRHLNVTNRMQFICADFLEPLPFGDKSFDLVVCKGSFDAVLTSAASIANIRGLVRETVRLLAPGHGTFFLVTHGSPDNRTVYLEYDCDINHYWNGVSVHLVPRPGKTLANKSDYVYICRKRSDSNVMAEPAAEKENVVNNSNSSSSTSGVGDITKKAHKHQLSVNTNLTSSHYEGEMI